MLFLLKRRWQDSLLALVLLVILGLGLRSLSSARPLLDFSGSSILLGVLLFAGVLFSDGLLHGLVCLTFGESYRRRQRELVNVFRGQSYAAMVLGALMAGAGEELVFRGVSLHPAYLAGGAVVFGLLHHIRRDLWPFTLWAIFQGLLFAGALYLTEALCVPMTAHFLHDLAGFLVFRLLRRQQALQETNSAARKEMLEFPRFGG
jgi:membrane protease YdiL (CAAX protease family)